jgi:hypothetical protein
MPISLVPRIRASVLDMAMVRIKSKKHQNFERGGGLRFALYKWVIYSFQRFIKNLFFMSPRTGHRSELFEMLPAFSFISWACAFRAGGVASIFSSGPIGLPSGANKWGLTQWAGSSGILWRVAFLVNKSLHRNRTGFEPQSASPFGRRAKASKILVEAAWA